MGELWLLFFTALIEKKPGLLNPGCKKYHGKKSHHFRHIRNIRRLIQTGIQFLLCLFKCF